MRQLSMPALAFGPGGSECVGDVGAIQNVCSIIPKLDSEGNLDVYHGLRQCCRPSTISFSRML